MRRIGIFAGTFDPVHEGHIAFAKAALDTGLEKVMFLPEPRPRRKQGVRAFEHRIAMVQLAVKDEPKFSTVILEQARFTPHETLPLLSARFKGYKLVLLFGDDVVGHLAHWPHVDALVKASELLIASRQTSTTDLKATLKNLERTRNLKFTYNIIHPGLQDTASSKIRLDLKHGKDPSGLPIKVATYIKRHGLYSSVVEEK